MSTPLLSRLLRELNPDDLLTELSRSCGIPSWSFSLRERLSVLPSEVTDLELFTILSETWWALSAEERASALALTPPLALLRPCWRAILACQEADEVELDQRLDELVSLSGRYADHHGVHLPLDALQGSSVEGALEQLRRRNERPPEAERASLIEAHLDRAWRELQGLRARERLEAP